MDQSWVYEDSSVDWEELTRCIGWPRLGRSPPRIWRRCFPTAGTDAALHVGGGRLSDAEAKQAYRKSTSRSPKAG